MEQGSAAVAGASAQTVGMRRQVKNQLQYLVLNQGVQQKHKLWTGAGRKLLEELPLEGWTARRREESLQMLDDLGGRIMPLDQAMSRQRKKTVWLSYCRRIREWDRSRRWRIRLTQRECVPASITILLGSNTRNVSSRASGLVRTRSSFTTAPLESIMQ
jgi:hypothetical protein